ncbi:aKG-HExxH-type peptide beta-hydroxylase [Streptomyces sp. NBC_01429]|uniref:aKG-HExxH-type peptide beta-hydroxylase n=1 Tax=Streptomyces sp. NBC_01429 TaxID=2903862 RepID=UPI002E2ABA4C|nr:HEXXH motif-containing putative peptide modification protein [Streptomyces sp. NBC_01429]
MISLKGPQSVVETLYVVSSAHAVKTNRTAATGGDALASLRASYHLMISDMQPVLRDVLPCATVLPVAVGAGESHTGLVKAFIGSVAGEDSVDYDIFARLQEHSEEELRLKRLPVEAALAEAERSWPEFRSLYELLVPVLLYAPDGGLAGGTASTVLGVLWLDPKEHWNTVDIQEFLLHEFIHHTLFLEERRFGFYKNMGLLVEDRYLTRSAIRQDRRPLDKVLHSIVVGTEVLLARHEKRIPHREGVELSLHPESGELLQGVLTSLDEVFALPLTELLRPRPIEILELCRERLAAIPAS